LGTAMGMMLFSIVELVERRLTRWRHIPWTSEPIGIASSIIVRDQAAEQRDLSPSSLSQIIRAFEERLGVRLIHRTTRSVSLTSGTSFGVMPMAISDEPYCDDG
jgi:hypothetical protein